MCYKQGLDFDDMSSFFPCKKDDAIQYINLAPKIVILQCTVSQFFVIFKFQVIYANFSAIFLLYFQGLLQL